MMLENGRLVIIDFDRNYTVYIGLSVSTYSHGSGVSGLVKLFDSELKIMNVLWQEGDCTAKYISDVLKEETGWNMNTTYTLIKRCISKGAIERTEPNFMCHTLIPKEEVQEAETNELIDKIYDGSADKLFAALLGRKKLSKEQIQKLKDIVGELE